MKNCEKKQKRGHLMGPLVTDHDAKELEGFVNHIKEVLQVFKVSARLGDLQCLPSYLYTCVGNQI